ncbi:gamma carbonic anhydrase family protein [Sinorhizobium chiapasense]|uniref:Gamma carbonic anhydrase family protein n=1 Tax=Sinorhizobium chiapasense TaxID=501572 RepID=A0ABZ2BI42_9HYPH
MFEKAVTRQEKISVRSSSRCVPRKIMYPGICVGLAFLSEGVPSRAKHVYQHDGRPRQYHRLLLDGDMRRPYTKRPTSLSTDRIKETRAKKLAVSELVVPLEIDPQATRALNALRASARVLTRNNEPWLRPFFEARHSRTNGKAFMSKEHQSVYNLGSSKPKIAVDAWIAPSATIVGAVTIGQQSSVWFNCVLRGDDNTIQIGARTNIQDGSVIHIDPGEFDVIIGNDVTVGHSCLIHGCHLEDRAFVGMASTVMNGCIIEPDGVLGARSLLTSGKRVKSGELWTGSPAKFVRILSEEEILNFRKTAESYVRKGERFRTELNAIMVKAVELGETAMSALST